MGMEGATVFGCGCCAGTSLLLRCPPALPPLGARRLLSIRLLQLLCESLLQVPHSSCAGPCSSSACVTGARRLLNDRPLLLLLLRECLARVSHPCCAALLLLQSYNRCKAAQVRC